MEARPEDRLRLDITLVVLRRGLVPKASSSSSICRGRDEVNALGNIGQAAAVDRADGGGCGEECVLRSVCVEECVR